MIDDELGKLIRQQTEDFMEKDWRTFVRDVRGRGDLQSTTPAMDEHPASQLIRHLAVRGAPAMMQTAPWTEAKIKSVLKRGPHRSCRDHLAFLREEILDFVRKGFWVMLPYRLLKKKMQKEGVLKRIRLSPPGVIPQRDRRPRWIVDYTFYGVNQETLQLGPKDAMQFGRALERVLYWVRRANPRYGPVYLGKVDLADGFYRVWLMADTIPQLAVTFPKYPGEEQMVAFPLALPMGWVESAKYFCAATETAVDLANKKSDSEELPPHPLEHLALGSPPPDARESDTREMSDTYKPQEPQDTEATDTSSGSGKGERVLDVAARRSGTADRALRLNKGRKRSAARIGQWDTPVLQPLQRPVRFTDVYVDDLLYGRQGDLQARIRHLRRLLHSIDEVFRPVDEQDSP